MIDGSELNSSLQFGLQRPIITALCDTSIGVQTIQTNSTAARRTVALACR